MRAKWERLAFDVPVAQVEGLPPMAGATFVDDDTLVVEIYRDLRDTRTPEEKSVSSNDGARTDRGAPRGDRQHQLS